MGKIDIIIVIKPSLIIINRGGSDSEKINKTQSKEVVSPRYKIKKPFFSTVYYQILLIL